MTNETISALIKALAESNSLTRENAAGALGKLGPKAKEAIPALIHALSDTSDDVREVAAGALGKIGPEAKEAVPALTHTLKDRNENMMVRAGASIALGLIEGARKMKGSKIVS